MTTEKAPHLKKGLSALHLWGMAVGLVISGEYFGWSYGWASAGTIGLPTDPGSARLGAAGRGLFPAHGDTGCKVWRSFPPGARWRFRSIGRKPNRAGSGRVC